MQDKKLSIGVFRHISNVHVIHVCIVHGVTWVCASCSDMCNSVLSCRRHFGSSHRLAFSCCVARCAHSPPWRSVHGIEQRQCLAPWSASICTHRHGRHLCTQHGPVGQPHGTWAPAPASWPPTRPVASLRSWAEDHCGLGWRTPRPLEGRADPPGQNLPTRAGHTCACVGLGPGRLGA